MKLPIAIFATVAAMVTPAARVQSAEATLAPDVLILNASVHTMDERQPTAQAVAVFGNRIVAVGANSDVQPLAGPRTRIVDGTGRLVLPGFNDAHVHFLSGGFSLTNVNLREARSPEELAELLRRHAARLPKGSWILGGDWDHEKWPGAALPTKEMIDPATPEHPVFVNRLDGHMTLANSLALRLAGINRNTPDVPGGVIVRHADTREPAGILKDAAQDLVSRVVPARTFAEKHAAAVAATTHAAQCGVTSVTDMSADDDVAVYQHMLDRGELKTRIYAARSITSWEVLARTGVRAAFGSDMLRIGALKGFADGSLGSSTALFFVPYVDNPETHGLLFDQMLPERAMLARVLGADRQGLQVMIHAIGDEANFRILELYEEAARQNGPRDRRFRIEHAQHLRTSEVGRFAAQKVVASMQPYHAADDGRWCEKRIGPERSKGAYVFRSLLDSGAVLAFGSDWTVAPLNPLLGIKAAVTRQTLDGKHPKGWNAREKISVQEAVRAFTFGAAYAEFAEQRKGSLTLGKLADLVVLDRDIFKVPEDEIDRATVLMTIVDGRIMYESQAK
jgi:predicted amidohydrolase YtcJ